MTGDEQKDKEKATPVYVRVLPPIPKPRKQHLSEFRIGAYTVNPIGIHYHFFVSYGATRAELVPRSFPLPLTPPMCLAKGNAVLALTN